MTKKEEIINFLNNFFKSRFSNVRARSLDYERYENSSWEEISKHSIELYIDDFMFKWKPTDFSIRPQSDLLSDYFDEYIRDLIEEEFNINSDYIYFSNNYLIFWAYLPIVEKKSTFKIQILKVKNIYGNMICEICKIDDKFKTLKSHYICSKCLVQNNKNIKFYQKKDGKIIFLKEMDPMHIENSIAYFSKFVKSGNFYKDLVEALKYEQKRRILENKKSNEYEIKFII